MADQPAPDFNILFLSMTNAVKKIQDATAELNAAAVQLNIAAVEMYKMKKLADEIKSIKEAMVKLAQNNDCQINRVETNDIARIHNSKTRLQLKPLAGPSGDPADNFPATHKQLLALNEEAVNNLAANLGLNPEGTFQEKRDALYAYVGVQS
ncbi:hypothetical protein B9Z19DRAFT_1156352 [Tuber borchii]|uniref:Uncharacterized protein n=1 Tax=Tuber borchii TaxID=42251 RepID=A0A2T6ZHD6_TUBBO|nr:hypothetical protein B9Z19DRAFT_1156352 [Tuber borchii]